MGQGASLPDPPRLETAPQIPATHPAVPPLSSGAKPPPGCPMHATSTDTPYALPPSSVAPEANAQKPAECPVSAGSVSSSPTAGLGGSLNPLNQMPHLPQTRAPNQVLDLPLSRESSSIPRPAASSITPASPSISGAPHEEKVWEYPSPQQFYNALVRKGWETPEEHVVTMVEIHNFLNEMAWQEVLQWEKRRSNGENSQLAKFQGHPGKLSPKARLHMYAGSLFPSKFNSTPPFDRHDWLVHRPPPASDPTGPATETRYVIDYYSAPEDENGDPVFYLDVRPALDGIESIKERIVVGMGLGDGWRGLWRGATTKASGGFTEKAAVDALNEL